MPRALVLGAVALILVGCAARVPVVTTATRGQPPEQQRRDTAECEARARREADGSGLAEALTRRVGLMLGGALVGAVVGFSIGAAGNDGDAERVGLATAGGAVLGAVAGYIAGTVQGVRDIGRRARTRAERELRRYADCMRDRGYTVEPERERDQE